MQQKRDARRNWYNQVRCHQALAGRTPDEVWNDTTRPPPLPILVCEPLKPAIEVRIGRFRRDENLPVVKIDLVRDAKRAA